MAGPLRWFRKYEKIMLGVFGVALMVAFTFSLGVSSVDLLGQLAGTADGPGSPGGSNNAGNPVVTTWEGGEYRESDFQNLQQGRRALIGFMQASIGTARSRGGQQRGQTIPPYIGDGSLMELSILSKKAEDMGLQISDQGVVDYLTQLTDGQVTKGEFKQIWKSVTGNQSNDAQLIALLRRELLAMRYRGMMQSGAFPVSPLRFWDYYNRLERTVKAELMPIPVKDYIDDVEEPANAALVAFFDKYKHQYQYPGSPEPGFRTRERAAFSYVKFDYEQFFEAELALVTDEQVAKYYEENKEEFREQSFLEDDLTVPDVPDSKSMEDSAAAPDAPAPDAPAPEAPAPEAPAGDATSTEAPGEADQSTTAGDGTTVEGAVIEGEAVEGTASEGAVEAAPEVSESAAEAVESVVPSPQSTPTPKPQTEGTTEGTAPAEVASEIVDSLQTETAEAAEAAPVASEVSEPAATTQVTEPAAGTEATAAKSTPPVDMTESAEADADQTKTGDNETGEAKTGETEAGEKTADADTDDDEEVKKYKPIEKVTDEIKRLIARPLAQQKMDKAIGAARAKCERYFRSTKLYELQTAKKMEAKLPSPPDFSEIETPTPLVVEEVPMSDELSLAETELGQSFDVLFDGSGLQQVMFPEVAFSKSLSLNQAGIFPGSEAAQTKFLYWRTEYEAAAEPKLEDIRTTVVDAWKKEQAKELALAAAEEAAKTARESDKPLSESIPGENRTFFETNQITWLTGGNVPLDTSTMPQPTTVEGVEAGDDFYRALFSLGKGEVGVARDQGDNNAYVIRMIESGPDLDVRQAGFFENAQMIPGISYVARAENRRGLFNLYRGIMDDAKLEWKREPRGSDQQ